ncbi:hypothetical protein [Haladaptatus sp. YSMS36]|uniref:hypothetical protein n=1 Tax=Haladaptatus sp. YSMS36 TaxID=3033384 RepID=UPI0023E7F9EE|nr:hypothetical protein [Haladaptatus sp. YSMS36]
MVSLEVALVALAFLIPLAVIFGSVAYVAYALHTHSVAQRERERDRLSRLQDRLDLLESARHIRSGTIVDVFEAAHRPKKWLVHGPPIPGIQVVIAIPTPTETVTNLWFRTPAALDGTSSFERFLSYLDASPADVGDIIGKSVPIRLTAAGEWRPDWVTDRRRRQPITSLWDVAALFVEREREEDRV